MMNEMNINRMNELLQNEEFAQKVTEAGSFEMAYELFAENGLTATYEEYMEYVENIRQSLVEQGHITEDGELSAEMLDMVSGGRWYHSLGCFALAGVAAYAGQPGAAVLFIVAGIALWKKK